MRRAGGARRPERRGCLAAHRPEWNGESDHADTCRRARRERLRDEGRGASPGARRSAGGAPDRDTIYLFSDDHLARGAFLAIAEAGLTIPRDIRIATWANAGIGPFHPRELSRIKLDPVAAGGTLARAALEFLRTGAYPAGTSIGPVWHDGETMGIPTTTDA